MREISIACNSSLHPPSVKKINKICKEFNIHVHDYHKTERENRKLGHITHVCDDENKMDHNIEKILEIL